MVPRATPPYAVLFPPSQPSGPDRVRAERTRPGPGRSSAVSEQLADRSGDGSAAHRPPAVPPVGERRLPRSGVDPTIEPDGDDIKVVGTAHRGDDGRGRCPDHEAVTGDAVVPALLRARPGRPSREGPRRSCRAHQQTRDANNGSERQGRQASGQAQARGRQRHQRRRPRNTDRR